MRLLWAVMVLVVLIGCVSIAGLMLGRTIAPRREMATRLALGSECHLLDRAHLNIK